MRRDRILLMSSALQFTLFVPLAWWGHKHRQPLVEVAVTRLVQKKQPSFMRSVVLVVNTLTGSAVFLNLLAFPVAAVLWKMRLRLEAVMTLASCWINVLGGTVIKQVVHRPRPHPPLVQVTKQSKGKSFPSGHTASSICLWGWLFALGLLSKNKRQPGRRALLSIPAAFVVFTGPARVYLGDHWATDVLGGYLFGGGWLGLALYFYLHLRELGILLPAQGRERSDVLSSR
jgi:membrane-associated phospholipid phosphatase